MIYCSKIDFCGFNIYVIFLFVFNLMVGFENELGIIVLYGLGFVIDILKFCELEEFVM